MDTRSILGISLGTRTNGIAIINGKELEVAHVHAFNERWSKVKLAAIMAVYDRYVREHAVRSIVVKIPKSSHLSLAIKQLIRAIDAYIKKQGCLVEYTTITKIKAKEPGVKNKRELWNLVVERYPMLIHEMRREVKNRQPYYTKLFEAVIVAHHAGDGGHE